MWLAGTAHREASLSGKAELPSVRACMCVWVGAALARRTVELLNQKGPSVTVIAEPEINRLRKRSTTTLSEVGNNHLNVEGPKASTS